MTSNSDLRQGAESIARLQTEVDEAKFALDEAYADAASSGYSKTALRKAMKIHGLTADKRAKHEQEQTDLELYLAEIEGREAAE